MTCGPDYSTPAALLALGAGLPQDALLLRTLEHQTEDERAAAKRLAWKLLGDDDEAAQTIDAPEVWALRVTICPSAVGREPGLIAWVRVPR